MAFTALGYDRPLAWVMLLGALIPCVDLASVRAQSTASLALELPHLLASGLPLAGAASILS